MAEFDMGVSTAPKRNNPNKRKKKKKSFFAQMISGLIPVKGDEKGEVLRKIVFLLSLIILVASAIVVLKFFLVGEEAGDYNQKLNEQLMLSNKITQEQIDKMPAYAINTEYAGFYEKNPDTIGYIEIPTTNIKYAVTQSTDNDYYLTHDFEHVKKEAGWIFADFRHDFKPGVARPNTVIYGHNLYTKHRFQSLENYTDIEFLKQIPVFRFDTLYDKNQYKIFGIMLVNTLEEHGEVFDYHNYLFFSNKAQFNNYVTQILDRSLFITGVDLKYGDELITLSTCDFKNTNLKEVRLVIFGRKLREGESPDVDTSKIIENEGYRRIDRLYKDNPKKYGEKWEGRKWDTSLVEGFEE